ncbi:MAG: MFS transporter [Hyphomicrobiales bacterium]|nr:MAG: MFS transporter [Hyphomicrobiales bacterium]
MSTENMSKTKVWSIIAIGCLVGMLAFGPRSIFGFFMVPMTDANGWSREGFAFAIAIQNLVWGIAQPFVGMVADKYGTARTLIFGVVFYVVGLLIMSQTTDITTLTLSAGVLVGIGVASSAFFLIIAAFARLLPERYHGIAFGLGTASGSAGQFLFSPIGNAFLEQYGYVITLYFLAACVAFVPLLVYPLRGKPEIKTEDGRADQTIREAIVEAFSHRSYRLLTFGFFVCGYHVAFITVHMPSYIVDLGLDLSLARWSIGIIGLFNIFGAILAGTLMMRMPKRYILSFIYVGRAVIITIFVLTPISSLSVIIFSAGMGVLWLSTVPPTQGLVKVMFGTRYMSMLFGFVFFSHQVGSFLGIWLGGKIFDATGSYDLMWWSSVVAGLAAAAVHWPIKEVPQGRYAVG